MSDRRSYRESEADGFYDAWCGFAPDPDLLGNNPEAYGHAAYSELRVLAHNDSGFTVSDITFCARGGCTYTLAEHIGADLRCPDAPTSPDVTFIKPCDGGCDGTGEVTFGQGGYRQSFTCADCSGEGSR